MKENLYLKRGIIIQSLSPVFLLLIIKHVHCDCMKLINVFFRTIGLNPWDTIIKAVLHPRFGELLIVVGGLVLVIISLLYIPAFKNNQDSGFESNGEQVIVIEEKKDAAALFLMTFIIPLLTDNLSSPQKWISYVLVIVLVYVILYKSNLYYQSPVLALLGYKVFSFEVRNPYVQSGMKKKKRYIGITRGNTISDGSVIIWKYISDDVFLVYNE